MFGKFNAQLLVFTLQKKKKTIIDKKVCNGKIPNDVVE